MNQFLAAHLLKVGTVCRGIELGKRVKNDVAESPGGVLQYEPIYRHIKASLRQYSSENSYVTTMFDFYAFPTDFPNYELLSKEPDALKRISAFEEEMSRQMNRDPRFIPNIQLHEFETLLYASLGELEFEFADDEESLMGLKRLLKDVVGLLPEEINQTREGAPSKRLLNFLPAYNKRSMGPRIIHQIGWERLRKSCPHFGLWLSRLENL